MENSIITNPKVGIGVFVVDPSNQKFLIGKRKDNKLYAQPGGWLEYGETLTECGMRELREETGLIIEEDRIKHIKTFNCFNPDEKYHNVAVYLYTEVNDYEVSLVRNTEPDKCEGWEWIDYKYLKDKYEEVFFPIKVFLDNEGYMYESITEMKKLIDNEIID